MRPSLRTRAAGAAVVMALAGLAGGYGCGPPRPKTYPVRGRVEVAGGDARPLAGCTVEAAQEGDPTVRASGVIQPDGSFSLETLHNGAILRGAQAGSYRARIIRDTDADRDARRASRAAVHGRFLQFQTSGLSFQVPADGEVVLKVAPR